MMLYHSKNRKWNYEIGIHIADVSYYLRRGSILDDEAYQRATLFI
jgi:exoribonuclease R